jgi:hypothetical protein
MIRKFKAFDVKTINSEFATLPSADLRDLTHAMSLYQQNAGVGYTVKNYGDDLMMIKGSKQGRCLWFAIGESQNGVEILIALLVYKKEGQEVPARVMERARERLRRYGS